MRPFLCQYLNTHFDTKSLKNTKIGNWKNGCFGMDLKRIVPIVDKLTFPHFPHQFPLLYLLRIIAIMLTKQYKKNNVT